MTGQEKIAIITDSGTNVPPEFAKEYDILVAPLLIVYKNETFKDHVTITPSEVYARLEQEVPKTALPEPADMAAIFEKAIADGCTHAICVTISSGLSGTYEAMELVAKEYPQLTIALIDTKNISIGAGLSVMHAARLRAEGLNFDEIVAQTRSNIPKSKIFFCVDTLDYLYQGGRIGLATYKLGSILKLHPVITCNEEGVYVTAAKVRGRKASLRKAVELTQSWVGDSRKYRLVVAQGDAVAEADEMAAQEKVDFPYNVEPVKVVQVSPALIVHTGPGLIGVGAQILD